MKRLRSPRKPAISSASPTPPCRRRASSTSSVAARRPCRGSIGASRSLRTSAPGGSWPTPGRRVGSRNASWGVSTRRKRTCDTRSGSPRSSAIASCPAGSGARWPAWPSCAGTRPRPKSAGAALEKRSPAVRVSSAVNQDGSERHEAQPLVDLGSLLAGSIEEYEVAAAVEMPPDQLRRDSRGDSPAPECLLGHDSDQLGRALPRVRDPGAGRNPVEPGQQEHAARNLELDAQHVHRRRLPVDIAAVRPADLLEGFQFGGLSPAAELRQVNFGPPPHF